MDQCRVFVVCLVVIAGAGCDGPGDGSVKLTSRAPLAGNGADQPLGIASGAISNDLLANSGVVIATTPPLVGGDRVELGGSLMLSMAPASSSADGYLKSTDYDRFDKAATAAGVGNAFIFNSAVKGDVQPKASFNIDGSATIGGDTIVAGNLIAGILGKPSGLLLNGRFSATAEGNTGRPIGGGIHSADPKQFVDPLNPAEQAAVGSSTGVAAGKGEKPIDNTWAGYDIVGATSQSGFVAARIATQWPKLASDTTDTNLLFATQGMGGFAERMRIDSAGNVGIGTPSPGVLFGLPQSGRSLHVNHDSDGARLHVQGTYSDIDLFATSAKPDLKGMIIRNDGGVTGFWPHNDKGVRLFQSGAVLAIDHASGFVGVGTTTPVAPLDVRGNVSVSATIRIGRDPGAPCDGKHEGVLNYSTSNYGSLLCACMRAGGSTPGMLAFGWVKVVDTNPGVPLACP